MSRSLVASFALLTALLVAPQAAGAHHDVAIQPGARMDVGCTLNFVFRGASSALYIGTAGHCVNGVGEGITVDDSRIGAVAWTSTHADFALIRIDSARHGDVDASMRHWGGPTGIAAAGTTLPGAPLYHTGWGFVYGTSVYSRSRAGVLTLHTDDIYRAETTAVWGDSGSPIITADGRALGIVSRFAFESASTDEGPTVQRILELASTEAGLGLQLVTAPLADPVERELARTGHRPIG